MLATFALVLALFREASTTLESIPMIATTTRSSIKVKAEVKPKLFETLKFLFREKKDFLKSKTTFLEITLSLSLSLSLWNFLD